MAQTAQKTQLLKFLISLLGVKSHNNPSLIQSALIRVNNTATTGLRFQCLLGKIDTYHLYQCCCHDDQDCDNDSDTNFSGEHKVIVKPEMLPALFI